MNNTENSKNRPLKREADEVDSLINTREAADLLQVHISTIRRWSNRGILESCHRGPRGQKLFAKKDVIDSVLIFKPYGVPVGLL